MKLFKSKYRKRIENKIKELTKEVSKMEVARNPYKQTLQPADYCHYSVIISDLNKQIELLKSLL